MLRRMDVDSSREKISGRNTTSTSGVICTIARLPRPAGASSTRSVGAQGGGAQPQWGIRPGWQRESYRFLRGISGKLRRRCFGTINCGGSLCNLKVETVSLAIRSDFATHVP
jgi:hypothetical protein